MAMILKHDIKKINNGYTITLYLNGQTTEFAEELGSSNRRDDKKINREIEGYVKNKFPNIKQATVRLMVGTMLVGTFAYGAPAMTKAAGEDAAKVTNPSEVTTTTDNNVGGTGDELDTDADAGGTDDDPDTDADAGGTDDDPDADTDAEKTDATTPKLKDVEEGKYYTEAVNELIKRGIINGYDDGTFKPGKDISRAEFVKILAEALELDVENAPSHDFKDIP